VLEAGLQRHINIPVVVYFVVNVVSFSSLRSLDLAKLLHLVLRHTENPLSLRGAIHQANEIHHYIAFLISKLFEAGKTSLYTIATLDSLMVLYRGTNHPIDCILLKAIQYIEGHLEQSCASRISSWSVLECTNKPLISRVRGHLEVSIDAKMLATSVFDTVPNSPNFVLHCLDTYLDSIKDNPIPVGKAYNPMFILPALTFCFISKSHVLEAQTAIDRHCFGFAIVCLSSNDKTTRQMAVGFLSTAISKLEDSPYHGKTQIRHLIFGLLASLSSQNAQTMDQPLPSATGIFLAQATQVLANPTHFVYKNIVELLLRQPLLQLHDLSLILSILQVGEEHHKEVSWILNILSAGLKTDQDLVLYWKCNVFDNILNLYTSPNCSERVKEKVLELLWNAAAIEGGGTTLITRNGVVAWVEQQLGVSQEEDFTLKRLVAKLSESLAKVHVREWSRGNLRDHFVGENAKLGVNV